MSSAGIFTKKLTNVFDNFKTSFYENKLQIAIICVIFITLIAVYYKKIVMPQIFRKFVENREFVLPQSDNTETNASTNILGGTLGTNAQGSESATLYYFYTDWCPMCKKAAPELKALKSETNGVVNGINIIFRDIDCDADSATADKFSITGYPTIKLVYRDKTYEYDAKPDRVVLTKFLTEIFNNPT